ncbi:protein of unknown function [Citrobacter amalonaticus]|uniref:Uncharacterized protein n=1 Tax=Citrobacter amalonaticus TaxID=35703 RepID=A0AAX2BKU3_CITAM|nr:protein of unknown function [Citrobacter amalonaticus]SAZ80756.1 protein of unknown function [Citrobacter amalonaticus]
MNGFGYLMWAIKTEHLLRRLLAEKHTLWAKTCFREGTY